MSDNVPEFTVSEISGKLKRTIEDTYGYVRVRGELGRVTRAGSGHVYLDLKDDRAVLSSVMWKGTAQRQTVKPEQGMEVVATGRMSTFPGQSRYQLIIDQLAPAGAGALMALYEERKKKLGEEGLFDPARKRPIPKLPKIIGVVTSPSGAVIRDILHRLRDRFPSRVIVWPTLVQGEGAAAGIIRGIEGFAKLPDEMRPDTLIVARGGGSLEDLWCFNDEGVVRAAAASPIPLISAVGHETDTTLIDFAADLRAPTPTAAAELAVPVRADLLANIAQLESRLSRHVTGQLESARLGVHAAGRGLGTPRALLQGPEQRFDVVEQRRLEAGRRLIDGKDNILGRLVPRLTTRLLGKPIDVRQARLDGARLRLNSAGPAQLRESLERVRRAVLPAGLVRSRIAAQFDRVESAGKLLMSVSYKGVLERGFALVTGPDGGVVKSAKLAQETASLTLTFGDGSVEVGRAATPPKKKKPAGKKADQADLF